MYIGFGVLGFSFREATTSSGLKSAGLYSVQSFLFGVPALAKDRENR